jgi:hypothetical protein
MSMKMWEKTWAFMSVALMKHTMCMKLDNMDEIVSKVKFTTQMQLSIWLTFPQIDEIWIREWNWPNGCYLPCWWNTLHRWWIHDNNSSWTLNSSGARSLVELTSCSTSEDTLHYHPTSFDDRNAIHCIK